MNAELFTPYRDRLTPVATIPMHTPEEAISALNHAVDELGMNSVGSGPINAVYSSYLKIPQVIIS
jgi:predicted TIM-barrel fold metal-dependent hydrolase